MAQTSSIQRPDRLRAQRWTEQIRLQFGGTVYATSFCVKDGVLAFLHRLDHRRCLWLAWEGDPPTWVMNFQGQRVFFWIVVFDSGGGETLRGKVGQLDFSCPAQEFGVNNPHPVHKPGVVQEVESRGRAFSSLFLKYFFPRLAD